MTRLSWVDFPKGALISILLAGLVFASIWVPELAHWYVSPAATTMSVLEMSRKAPDQSVLDEVAAMGTGAVKVARTQVVSTAEQVMSGTLNLPGFPPAPIALPFASADLVRGLPTYQLAVASLVSADVLLDAYRMTRREEFFRQARDVIVSFARYEAAQWGDRGLMWNDHAIGARIPVLVKFWAEYRAHPEFDPRIGRIVLDLVARSAHLLAKPSFYAWRTGHGIVADVAMLQMAGAFPELPGIAEIRSVAARRFRDHLNYWINEEGVTLLHSAGYHSRSLFGVALRLHTLNGIKIPEEWWKRYGKAVDFDSLLRRPDGTLPMYGDTMSTPREAGWFTARRESDGTAEPLSERTPSPPSNAFAVYPVAGHAILWDGLPKPNAVDSVAAQTAITWSYHPGLGHKVADELSMLVWANGRTWLTNTGYWPYGVPGREQAESWEASNAPHLVGESKSSDRTSRVRGMGQGDGIAFIDLERSGPQGYSVRRQIVRLVDDKSWVVLDHSLDSTLQTTTTNWTFYPDLSVTPLEAAGRYRVTSANSRMGMVCSFSGSEGFRTELTVGRATPFAGWVVLDRTPTPAPSIVVHQPSRGSWSLSAFALSDAEQTTDVGRGAHMDKWIDAEHWTAVMSTASGEVTLVRDGSRVVVHRHSSPDADVAINLSAREAPAADIGVVRDAVRSASENYHKFRELISDRVRVSYLLLALLVGQELLLFLMRRRLPGTARTLRMASWVGWASGGYWLTQVYFSTPS
jgi:hypothetical protein